MLRQFCVCVWWGGGRIMCLKAENILGKLLFYCILKENLSNPHPRHSIPQVSFTVFSPKHLRNGHYSPHSHSDQKPGPVSAAASYLPAIPFSLAQVKPPSRSPGTLQLPPSCSCPRAALHPFQLSAHPGLSCPPHPRPGSHSGLPRLSA